MLPTQIIKADAYLINQIQTKYHIFPPEESETFVAMNNEVIGMIVSFTSEQGCFLTSFFVDPAWRNQGIGKELLSAAMKNKERVSLYTENKRTENKPAIHLYKQLGFIPIWNDEKETLWKKE